MSMRLSATQREVRKLLWSPAENFRRYMYPATLSGIDTTSWCVLGFVAVDELLSELRR